MKSSPTLRVLMAAGMYLLLMWGYMILQTPQYFAVFAAFVMCVALFFWVSEAIVGKYPNDVWESKDSAGNESIQETIQETIQCEYVQPRSENEPSLSMSVCRLDALKEELTQQYAQFGKDQSSLNSKGLGTWQPKRAHKGRDTE